MTLPVAVSRVRHKLVPRAIVGLGKQGGLRSKQRIQNVAEQGEAWGVKGKLAGRLEEVAPCERLPGIGSVGPAERSRTAAGGGQEGSVRLRELAVVAKPGS